VNGVLRVVDDVPTAFTTSVIAAFESRPDPTLSLALSGGNTARRCYERLAASIDRIDWSCVHVFWSDERCVPPDSPYSNERLAREALLQRAGAVGAVYPMRCEQGAESYDALVRQREHIDVVHLGLGPDGHTASLFPHSPALCAGPDRLVAMNYDPLGNNPFLRMTFTFAAIARARLVLFTVEGKEKRQALARVLAGDPTAPATHVDAERIEWIVDPAAADEQCEIAATGWRGVPTT
jgi:6-phosphogluconolactonase